MMLSIGARIGAYEIVGFMGADSMGELYRGRHATLGREVALKLLPAPFALDTDRVSRLRREVQVLRTVNHPHIGAVFGIEESRGVLVLVLELVEGPTLAERLAQGPMAISEVRPIAKQICEALEAAHQQGIVHRDLRPANIKIGPGGVVKVLGFGLAEALAVTIGTFGYIGPWQASATMYGRSGACSMRC
jgi:serine/threonine protein kinase